jgi:uncharacterized protein YgiM (DUF1202 family)
MVLRLGFLLSLMLMSACSESEPSTKEPVAAEQKAEKAPDAPGVEAGEAAGKPAGVGSAEASAAAAAAPEKSEPAVDAAKAAAPTAAYTVKPKNLNVRKGPSTKDPVVRKLSRGEKVEALSCAQSWCKIAENEYVSEKYLTKSK